MEIMRLIFGSFWVYCGVVIMIYVAALCLSMIVGTVISTIRGDSVKINIGRGNVFRVTPKSCGEHTYQAEEIDRRRYMDAFEQIKNKNGGRKHDD